MSLPVALTPYFAADEAKRAHARLRAMLRIRRELGQTFAGEEDSLSRDFAEGLTHYVAALRAQGADEASTLHAIRIYKSWFQRLR